MVSKRRIAALSLGVGLLALAPVGIAQLADTSSADTAIVDIDPAVLAGSVRPEIARIGSGGSVEDYEASILFVVSQQNYPTDSIRGALTSILGDQNLSTNARTAIRNILLQLARRRFNRGTGAIAGTNGGAGFGSSSFSTPVVTVGGGSSNYTN